MKPLKHETNGGAKEDFKQHYNYFEECLKLDLYDKK